MKKCILKTYQFHNIIKNTFDPQWVKQGTTLRLLKLSGKSIGSQKKNFNQNQFKAAQDLNECGITKIEVTNTGMNDN